MKPLRSSPLKGLSTSRRASTDDKLDSSMSRDELSRDQVDETTDGTETAGAAPEESDSTTPAMSQIQQEQALQEQEQQSDIGLPSPCGQDYFPVNVQVLPSVAGPLRKKGGNPSRNFWDWL